MLENEFQPIRQIGRFPLTFMHNHLMFSVTTSDEDGNLPYVITRFDGLEPTDEDHAVVEEHLRFILRPTDGSIQ